MQGLPLGNGKVDIQARWNKIDDLALDMIIERTKFSVPETGRA